MPGESPAASPSPYPAQGERVNAPASSLYPSEAPNQHSTCEWVDDAYSRRLWAQLLLRRFPHRASLLTVRNGGDVIELRVRGRRFWGAQVFAIGPNESLDMVSVVYDGAGRRISESVILRISRHAGRRLFMRLRTNAAEDLARTAVVALCALLRNRELCVLVRARERLAKTAATERAAELLADFERQLGTIYSYDTDVP
jgi:hypothetical protein